MHTYRAHQDISVLSDHLEVPGLGFLAVNAFVIHAAQPVVIDTGLGLPDRDFAAPLPTAELASAHDAAAADPRELRAAQLLWATVDSPWVHTVDPARYAASFQPLRDFGPSVILSTRLPPVTGDTDALFTAMLDAPRATVFTGPDQAALEAMLRDCQPA